MNSLTLVFFHLLLASAFRLNSAIECVGCKQPVQDTNSDDIRKLMSSTLSKTNAGSSLSKINNCSTKVVAGRYYDCNVEIKSPSGELSTCNIQVVERPWEKDNEKKVQVVSESCSSVSRSKREVCAGCPMNQDANSSKMQKKLSGILSQTNSGLSLVRGEKCTSQIVAGTKYDCTLQVESPKTNGVQTCKLAFIEQPWLSPDPKVVYDTCSSLVRNKREVCAGCPVEQDANSGEMKKKLTGVLSQTNSGLSLVKGEKCTSKIVAGVMYDCTLQVESPKTNGVQTCKISFVEQPWISSDPTIVSDTCSKLVRSKRAVCAGCPIEKDPNDPEIQKKVTGSLHQVNADLTIVGFDKCTSQVVAGALYKCTVRVTSPKINGVETCQVEILEQPWINKEPQLVKSTCSQLDRSMRELFGGLKEVDSSEKVLVQELAAVAMKTLDDVDSDNKKRIVTEVISAHKQLVNGIMYHLKLRVRSTSCDENKDLNGNCLFEDIAPQNICDVQVYRSFADDSPLNARVVKSMCEPAKEVKKLGGFEPVQTNGDEVQKAAKFAGKRISEMVNSIYVKRIISIESAATQVVSGVKYALTLVMGDTDCLKNNVNKDSVCKFQPNAKTNLVCQVEVYEKPWENEMKLTSSNCKEEPNVSVERARRALLGGYEPVQSNDGSIQEAAAFAEKRINQMVNSLYFKKIVSVEQASKQIVSGTNYKLVLRLQDTDCKKNKVTANSICPFLPNSKMDLVCSVVVYKDLKSVMHLSSANCDDVPQTPTFEVRNKRSMTGQYQPVETNDLNVQKAASIAQIRINQMVNSAYIKQVSSIEEAKFQVVAGTNIALVLILQDTNCFKNQHNENSICQFNPDVKMVLSCDVVVFKDLNNTMSVSSVHCTDIPRIPNPSPRNKRTI